MLCFPISLLSTLPLPLFTAKQSSSSLPHRLLTSALVNIYVGEENTHWILHERLLCYHSRFFANIFYSKENESSKSKNFGFPDADDAPFEVTRHNPSPYSPLLLLHFPFLLEQKWPQAQP